jgi:hypothetical protein
MVNVFLPGMGAVDATPENKLLHRHLELLKMDEGQVFWARRGREWPKDLRGNIFLGNAVHFVGSALFGKTWTGSESAVDQRLAPLPTFAATAKPWEVRQAWNLLEHAAAKNAAVPHRPYGMEQRAWVLARTSRQENMDELKPIRARLSAVRNALVDHFVNSRIATRTLPLIGGEFSTDELAWSVWNVPGNVIEARFANCQIGTAWIFANGAQLAEQFPKVLTETTLARRSEFLAFMNREVADHPSDKPHSKDHYVHLGRTDYRLPVEEARDVWREALDAVPGNNWAEPGRPPKVIR